MKHRQQKTYDLLRLDGKRSPGNRKVTLVLVVLILLASAVVIVNSFAGLPLYLVLFAKLDVESLETLRLLRLFVLLKFNRYFHTLDTVFQVVKVKRRKLPSPHKRPRPILCLN